MSTYRGFAQQLVILDGETVTLTRMQYRVLALLVQHAGEVVPRPTLSMQIWGHVLAASSRAVDIHIRGLRRKLGVYGGMYIETVVGIGYRFRTMPRG